MKNGWEDTEQKKKKIDVWKYKTYRCTSKIIDIETDKKIIVLNEDEAKEHDIYPGYRTELSHNNKKAVVIVDVSNELIKPGEVGIFKDTANELRIKEKDKVEIIHMDRPPSIEYIKNKLDGKELSPNQIEVIVKDIMANRLSEVETSAWITSAYVRGFTETETVGLTNATVKSGHVLNIKKKIIADKHSIGGVVGNRTTMVLVPIIASFGITIPKTSSRAITSPAGTADTMEVLSDVEFKIEELKKIVEKTNGAIVWGGGMNLAPIDDKLIRIRHSLSLDPHGMLLASILGKKKSVGATHVIIDIPVGRGAKVPYLQKAHELAQDFIKIGKHIDMKIETLITDGSEPIGDGIGPALECRDVLKVLEGSGPEDLRHKSCILAGKLLELCGYAKNNEGYPLAVKAIESGKALKKMKQIIEYQGGNPKISSEDVPIGEYKYDVVSERSGKIFHIDNKSISKLARLAGAPRDKGAGVHIYRIRGDRVEKGDKLFTIFAESEAKLGFAIKALDALEPVEMRKMLLGVLE